jgi:hypothetical protein
MNRRESSLEAQIAKLKQEIARLGDLRPGKLSQQYNVCGKADCRCKADPPQKHGPYYQLSFTRNGKSSTQFCAARRPGRGSAAVEKLPAVAGLDPPLDHFGNGTVASQSAAATGTLPGGFTAAAAIGFFSENELPRLISEPLKLLRCPAAKGFRVSRQKLA